jgi:hypothetical protein
VPKVASSTDAYNPTTSLIQNEDGEQPLELHGSYNPDY